MSTSDKTMKDEFFARWGNAIASVLGQIAGAPWTAAAESGSRALSGETVALDFTLDKSLSGRVRLSLARDHARTLITLFTGEAPPAEWGSEQQEAIEELARQFAGQFATALKPDVGEVEFRLEAGADFTAEPASAILLNGPQGEALRLEFEIDPPLNMALSPPPSPPSAGTSTPSEGKGNLDLLMDIELGVTLRFGQRQMMLQDILDLQSGSVIELDREIQQPVDLLLDGRVIARGSVVVVDGNYGLRVTEVGSAMIAGV